MTVPKAIFARIEQERSQIQSRMTMKNSSSHLHQLREVCASNGRLLNLAGAGICRPRWHESSSGESGRIERRIVATYLQGCRFLTHINTARQSRWDFLRLWAASFTGRLVPPNGRYQFMNMSVATSISACMQFQSRLLRTWGS